ncbi:MAG: arylamine N-acetyltransferase family protein [Acidimicrobiales bacterium]
MLPIDVRDGYLHRLEVDPEPPSVDALIRLQRAHVERIPWETAWIQMSEAWSIDPVESARRIAHVGRGGYCLHLNGAFGLLLESLGYDVTRHVGGVHGPAGPAVEELTNHLALTVSGLPTDAHPEGVWYVDAGLGDALHEPLPLAPGTYEQGAFRYELAANDDPAGDWRFIHHPGRGFTGMAWLAASATTADFESRHVEMSTSPSSPFVRWLVLQRRHADGVDVLQGRRLTRSHPIEGTTTIDDCDALVEALVEVFGVDLRQRDPAVLDALWQRIRRTEAETAAARSEDQ